MGVKADDVSIHYDDVMRILCGRGLLLGSYDAAGAPNVMIIGWGTLGIVWGLPVWAVLVRPSRYTFECIEEAGAFSVAVPGKDLAKACAVCGSQSGRDGDKLGDCGLSARPGRKVKAPLIEQCPIHYECTVVAAHDLDPARLDESVKQSAYPHGDFHRVYWGRIDRIDVADDVAAKLVE